MDPAAIAANNFMFSAVNAPRLLGDVPLANILDDPGFTIQRSIVHKVGDKPLVLVDFRYKPKGINHPDAKDPRKPKITCVLEKGTIILDRERAWSAQQTTLQYINGIIVNIQLEYKGEHRGLPVISKIIEEIAVTGHAQREVSWLQFSDLRFHDVPESDFTLSAFGLPEPVGVEWEQPRPRWYLWIMVVAFALLALALTLGYLRKRRSAPPAA
jgi:hypothetical protein